MERYDRVPSEPRAGDRGRERRRAPRGHVPEVQPRGPRSERELLRISATKRPLVPRLPRGAFPAGPPSMRSCASTSDAHAFQSMDTAGVSAPGCCRVLSAPVRRKFRRLKSTSGFMVRACRRRCRPCRRACSMRSDRVAVDLARGKDRDRRLARQGLGAAGVGALPRGAACRSRGREARGLALEFSSRRRRQCGDRAQLARARDPHGVRRLRYPDLERFLLETGRWDFVVTLYTDARAH